MELWINELWLLFTAVIFTVVGYWWGFKTNAINISEAVIDSLIEQKFLKTRGHGDNMEVIPWTEWCDDQTSK
jgi:hypothetical protein